MWTPGMGELLIILVIVLVIFGAGKLPSVGKSLGEGIKGFKDSVTGDDDAPDDSDSKKKSDSDDDKE